MASGSDERARGITTGEREAVQVTTRCGRLPSTACWAALRHQRAVACVLACFLGRSVSGGESGRVYVFANGDAEVTAQTSSSGGRCSVCPGSRRP